MWQSWDHLNSSSWTCARMHCQLFLDGLSLDWAAALEMCGQVECKHTAWGNSLGN